jgi:hypothetical protein
VLDEENFAGIISENHARVHARAPAWMPLWARSASFRARHGRVPNCSVGFHLTHVALKCRADVHWETTGGSSVHTRGDGVCSPSPEKFDAILFVKAHGNPVLWNNSCIL